ncbi:hypothetical protein BDK51DRAFT_47170 [Blyttiomyces helicus]|uniref:Uncharacterized protein n=1 Tax=Blyttiomyces helicus TaxID=388810 RepID=A0A4P9WMC8_9FUNG|nr:hypothetical protein BDK51DRAFT_47170 [Blyttiomyces helicus]|eukprot:RKO92330.1 hypothetical protein BDK51DRAFT_47170 [Blyttiomyces helicus]
MPECPALVDALKTLHRRHQTDQEVRKAKLPPETQERKARHIKQAGERQAIRVPYNAVFNVAAGSEVVAASLPASIPASRSVAGSLPTSVPTSLSAAIAAYISASIPSGLPTAVAKSLPADLSAAIPACVTSIQSGLPAPVAASLPASLTYPFAHSNINDTHFTYPFKAMLIYHPNSGTAIHVNVFFLQLIERLVDMAIGFQGTTTTIMVGADGSISIQTDQPRSPPANSYWTTLATHTEAASQKPARTKLDERAPQKAKHKPGTAERNYALPQATPNNYVSIECNRWDVLLALPEGRFVSQDHRLVLGHQTTEAEVIQAIGIVMNRNTPAGHLGYSPKLINSYLYRQTQLERHTDFPRNQSIADLKCDHKILANCVRHLKDVHLFRSFWPDKPQTIGQFHQNGYWRHCQPEHVYNRYNYLLKKGSPLFEPNGITQSYEELQDRQNAVDQQGQAGAEYHPVFIPHIFVAHPSYHHQADTHNIENLPDYERAPLSLSEFQAMCHPLSLNLSYVAGIATYPVPAAVPDKVTASPKGSAPDSPHIDAFRNN